MPQTGKRRSLPLGFTLTELMVVVLITSVLATIAISTYRKYVSHARKAEVYAMFGEIRNREEAYRAEHSSYYNTSTSETVYYPASVSPIPQNWSPATSTGWAYLGVKIGRNSVYCGYNVLSGAANTATITGGSGTLGASGSAWFGGSVPTVPWWYANATCDNDGDSSVNASYMTSMDNRNVYESQPNR